MKNFRAWTMAALCVVLCALTACSSGSSYVRSGYNFNSVGKVAVIVSLNVGSPAQQQEVADLFAMQVLRKGYDVIDRANIADLANEAAFQNSSGITSTEGRTKLAIDNVSTVVVVNVSTPLTGPYYSNDGGQEIAITAKMLDVRSGTLLWAGEGNGELKSGLATFGGALVGAGAGAAVGSAIGNTGGAVIGGVAGALGGGAAGAALEENQAQLLRSVIRKTCEELPALMQPR
jgi:hypothetical protein